MAVFAGIAVTLAHLFGVLRRLNDDFAVILAALDMLCAFRKSGHRRTQAGILIVVILHVPIAITDRTTGHGSEIANTINNDITLAVLFRQVHQFINAKVAFDVFVVGVLE